MDLGTRPTADEIKVKLGLEPHPTCGFVAETYRSPLKIPAGALPEAYEGDRPYGSAVYFLVAPDAQIVMHRIRSDQLYHHYLGDPLEVLMLYPDGTRPRRCRRRRARLAFQHCTAGRGEQPGERRYAPRGAGPRRPPPFPGG
jgi:predicted cupin superfamily sugar epimerase